MKKNAIYLLFFALLCLFSCSEKDKVPPKSSLKSIKSFNITNLTPNVTGLVDTITHTVQLTFPIGTNVSTLIPSITISPKASISPNTEVAQDFSQPLTYTVTAEDGTTQLYTIKTTVLKSAAKRVTGFSFTSLTPIINADIDTLKHTITATVPVSTDITSLTPTITISNGATIAPGSTVAQDFSKPVNYVVTAEDGSTQSYTVTVLVTKNYERKITSFVFNVPGPVSATIYENNDLIEATLPAGTDITKLAPEISISKNARISPASGSVQNFSSPVVYTVTAENGISRTYKVSVTAPKAISNDPAKGVTVNNHNFIAKTALIKERIFSNPTTYTIDFHDEEVGCNVKQFPPVSFSLTDLRVGYKKEACYFYNGNSSTTSYLIAEVEITKVTATTIEGKVRGGSVANHQYLEGSFSAVICD